MNIMNLISSTPTRQIQITSNNTSSESAMMTVVLSCAILSVYMSMTIAQPSNCCSSRCHYVTGNNLSIAEDENDPWHNNWYDPNECRANDDTNTTTANAPAANASMFCPNLVDPNHQDGTANGWMHGTEQYYTCCVTEKNRLSVAQLTTTLILACFTAGFIIVLMIGILRSKEVRRQPFNAYLVFLFVPSLIWITPMIVTTPLLFNCILSGLVYDNGAGSFYGSASLSLNAVIAHDIYVLLRKSKKCMRTKPLPLSTIYKRVTVVYLIAALYGVWVILLVSDVIESLPAFSFARSVAIWIVNALLFMPPIFYVFYVCIRVWKDKLLPLSGETRALAFYFLRIAIVFFFFWVPSIILSAYYVNRQETVMHFYNLTYFFFAAEIVSVALALTKPDVLLAVKRLLCNGRGYQQWKARRMRLSTESAQISSEEVSDEPAESGRRAENSMRVSAWDKPDDYGDNIVREISWKTRANRRVDGYSVNNEENE